METKICSKCKKEKPITEFNTRKRKTKISLQSNCISCNKEYAKQHYNDNKVLYIKRKEITKKALKDWFVDYKSTLKCEICGYNKCIEALDFHHINVDEKDFAISVMINSQMNKTNIINEINKCMILCANCHREIHSKKAIHLVVRYDTLTVSSLVRF